MVDIPDIALQTWFLRFSYSPGMGHRRSVNSLAPGHVAVVADSSLRGGLAGKYSVTIPASAVTVDPKTFATPLFLRPAVLHDAGVSPGMLGSV